MNVDIIGAGIGGLTVALALEKKGFAPVIYEQAKTLNPVGSGIILASNAMQVFKHLGISEQIKAHGAALNSLNITDQNLDVVSKVDLTYFKEKYALQSIAIHRGMLQQILLDNLKSTTIHLGHKINDLKKKSDGYTLHFKNNKTIHSPLLIGADGIRSTVRKTIASKSKTRTTNQICWRGVIPFDLPNQYKNELNEAWGKGNRFAFVQIGKGQLYWYALKSFNQTPEELPVSYLATYFEAYPPIVQEILLATPLKNIHTAVMEDLSPIRAWHDEFACLIGDAAHAATPNMGQGACQSIEDAYKLAENLAEHSPIKAFGQYQKSRLPKVHQVVNQSWRIGKVSHWKNPIAIFLRNSMMRLVPKKMSHHQLEKLFDLQNRPA